MEEENSELLGRNQEVWLNKVASHKPNQFVKKTYLSDNDTGCSKDLSVRLKLYYHSKQAAFRRY